MGKWTRGQWEVKDWGKPEYLDGVQMQFMVRVFDPSKIVCYCGSEQDARLIAAAPEMAELLERMVVSFQCRALDDMASFIKAQEDASALLSRLEDK